MAKQERQQKSTITNMIETFKNANNLPSPPVALDLDEMIVFEHLVRSRELATWTDHDLQLAANLAQIQCQLSAAIASVKKHGRMIVGSDGVLKVNPEVQFIIQLSNSVKSTTNLLGLSASHRGVAGSKQKIRDMHERDARSIIEANKNDDLLA
jgi:phage terminase small subunit